MMAKRLFTSKNKEDPKKVVGDAIERVKRETTTDIVINEWLYDCTYGKLMDQLAIANPKLRQELLGGPIVQSGNYGKQV
jgi:predicted transcriptional regulator